MVANPPYIAGSEVESLPRRSRTTSRAALVSGPTGLEAIEAIVGAAPQWLAPGAALVVEIAPHQAGGVGALAAAAGFTDVVVRDDLHRPPLVVARVSERR